MGLKQLAEKTYAERAKEVDEELRAILESRRTQIKVVGAGGAGNNTLTRLMQIGIVVLRLLLLILTRRICFILMLTKKF